MSGGRLLFYLKRTAEFCKEDALVQIHTKEGEQPLRLCPGSWWQLIKFVKYKLLFPIFHYSCLYRPQQLLVESFELLPYSLVSSHAGRAIPVSCLGFYLDYEEASLLAAYFCSFGCHHLLKGLARQKELGSTAVFGKTVGIAGWLLLDWLGYCIL